MIQEPSRRFLDLDIKILSRLLDGGKTSSLLTVELEDELSKYQIVKGGKFVKGVYRPRQVRTAKRALDSRINILLLWGLIAFDGFWRLTDKGKHVLPEWREWAEVVKSYKAAKEEGEEWLAGTT